MLTYMETHNHKQIGTRLGEPYTAGMGQKRANQGLNFVGFTEWLEHSLSQGQGWGGGGESISVSPISLWLATELQLYLNTCTQKWRGDTRMRHSTTTDYGDKWGALHSFPTHTISPRKRRSKLRQWAVTRRRHTHTPPTFYHLLYKICPVRRFRKEGQRARKGDDDSWAKNWSSIFSRVYFMIFSKSIMFFDLTENVKDG